jgi:hypothetical protein
LISSISQHERNKQKRGVTAKLTAPDFIHSSLHMHNFLKKKEKKTAASGGRCQI